MTSATVVKNVLPASLADAATTKTLQDFLTLYGDTLLMLVKLRDDATLTAGLGGAQLHGSLGTPVRPVLGTLGFETQMDSDPVDMVARITRARRPEAEAELVRLLDREKHFGVPLRKRRDAEALYPDRISVGRAPNKDIVIRHASVSKSHGWFEMNEIGGLYLVDAGSKNGTHVNGRRLVVRERTLVVAGDAIMFGSIEALLCAPEALWAALSGHGARGGK